jgi:hypothetical protein
MVVSRPKRSLCWDILWVDLDQVSARETHTYLSAVTGSKSKEVPRTPFVPFLKKKGPTLVTVDRQLSFNR